MSYDLTESHESITGKFWLPGEQDREFDGRLHLKAGKPAQLEASSFYESEKPKLFSNQPPTGELVTYTGADFEKAMRLPAKKIIHGHDSHGHPITLIKCSTHSTHSTMAMEHYRLNCEAAIFGAHISAEDLKLDGIRLRLDHLDTWLGRIAFQQSGEYSTSEDGGQKLSKIVIHFADKRAIPLSLPGYAKSEFYCGLSSRTRDNEFGLIGTSYLDLYFQTPKSWDDVVQELHQWQWFFGLATRSAADVCQMDVYRSEVRVPIGSEPMEAMAVWLKRKRSDPPSRRKYPDLDFFFAFNDVETAFPAIIGHWQRIQQPWAPVLHRYFAISHRKGLWQNEIFLFLAQAIESLHRARTGGHGGKVDLNQAAKHAYLNAPADLQALLGDRSTFIEQFRQSRNYWTHYGEPSPVSRPDVVLGDEALYQFCKKLRWIVEAAILQEIGIPEHCVSRVWSRQHQSYLVQYE